MRVRFPKLWIHDSWVYGFMGLGFMVYGLWSKIGSPFFLLILSCQLFPPFVSVLSHCYIRFFGATSGVIHGDEYRDMNVNIQHFAVQLPTFSHSILSSRD